MEKLRQPTQFLLSSFVLVLISALTAHELYAQTEDNGFYLHDNGVTIVCNDASVGDSGTINGVTYTKIDSKNSLQVFGGPVPADQACTSGVTNLSLWFYGDFPSDPNNEIKYAYNPSISHWDVSDVTKMNFTFTNLRGFNQDLSHWDVSNVKSFVGTFQNARSFNSDITTWDVSSAENFRSMFATASAFNQDISNWNVSGLDVTNVYGEDYVGMQYMFGDAISFNQNLSGWCVSALDSPEHYTGFANGAPLQSNYYPQWGRCPGNDPGFELADNGVTVTCIDAEVGAKGTISGKTYTRIDSKNDLILFGGDVRADEACTSGITTMNQWFINQTNFNEDISHWDVSGVTNMNSMFYMAENFNADLQYWDVGKVSTFSYMFTGAEAFNADISSWNTSSATIMEYMFGVARSFNQDISSWDVSNVTHMNDMFDGASVFNQDLSQWNVGKVTNMKEMFQGANAFNQDIGHWDVSNVTNMAGMLKSADAFNQDLSGWCVSNLSATSSRENFNQEGVIATDYLPQWGECPPNDPAFELADNGVTVTCKGVSAGAGGTIAGVTYTKIDQKTDLDLYSGGTVPADQACTSNVTDMSRWFHQASSFNDDISHWDVSSVTNMSEMFKSAINFTQDLKHWDVSNLQNANEMFSAATNFNGNIDAWQTLSLLQMEEMFAYTNEFNRDIGSWEVSNVSNVDGLFVAAEKFNQDLSQWNLSKATDYSSMFEGADTFNQDLSSWDVSHVESMSSMFYHADAFDQDLSSWCVEKVTTESNYERFAEQTLLTDDQIPLWGKCPVGDVVLISPEDDATDVSINPTLSWQAADRAEGYYVSISKPEEFITETVITLRS
jgi:surface protein